MLCMFASLALQAIFQSNHWELRICCCWYLICMYMRSNKIAHYIPLIQIYFFWSNFSFSHRPPPSVAPPLRTLSRSQLNICTKKKRRGGSTIMVVLCAKFEFTRFYRTTSECRFGRIETFDCNNPRTSATYPNPAHWCKCVHDSIRVQFKYHSKTITIVASVNAVCSFL